MSYSKDGKGFERYLAGSNGGEKYIDTTDAKKVFAETAEGFRYARDEHEDEFYPTVGVEVVVLRDEHGRKKYARTKGGKREIYPKRFGYDSEMVPTGMKYAKRDDGSEIYPRLFNGNEFDLPSLGPALDVDGNPTYPTHVVVVSDGRKSRVSQYPKNNSGDDVYLTKNKYEDLGYVPVVFGTDERGNEMYAKTAANDEFYPPHGSPQFAVDVRLKEHKWARDKDGYPVFPKNRSGDEFYVKSIDGANDVIAVDGCRILNRYAKLKSGNEIYPVKKTDRGVLQVPLNDSYAVSDGSAVYPADEFGNEYVVELLKKKKKDRLYPIGYPITCDDFVVVAVDECKRRPLHFADVRPYVSLSSLKKRLFRSWNDYSDFLSVEKHPSRKSKNACGTPYLTKDAVFDFPWKTWTGVLAAVVLALLLWVLNLKKVF